MIGMFLTIQTDCHHRGRLRGQGRRPQERSGSPVSLGPMCDVPSALSGHFITLKEPSSIRTILFPHGRSLKHVSLIGGGVFSCAVYGGQAFCGCPTVQERCDSALPAGRTAGKRSATVQWAQRPAVGARLFCRPRESLGASRSVEVSLICGVCVPSGACGSDGAPWGVCVAFGTPARSHANVVTPRWVRALLPSACPGLPIASELWAGCRQSDVSR